MIKLTDKQIVPPTRWEDLEDLSYRLWKRIWKDPQTLKHGRQGQPQAGVDVYGRPGAVGPYSGVQCKLKTLDGTNLTPKELKAEVQKAKNFIPKLSEFIVVTTGKRDVKVQQEARNLTVENEKNGLFSVQVYFWEDLLLLLEDNEDVAENYLAVYSPLNTVLNQQIDVSRDLLEDNRPDEALKILETIKKNYWSTATDRIKFRIITNIANVENMTGVYDQAAAHFLEAFPLDPESDIAQLNAAVANYNLGNTDEAKRLALVVIESNPYSEKAYAIICLTSFDNESPEETFEKLPKSLKDSPIIATHMALRYQKNQQIEKSIEWLRKAVKGDDPDVMVQLACALLERITPFHSIFDKSVLRDDERADLIEAVKLLDKAIDIIEGTSLKTHKSDWFSWRGIAKSLLDDLSGAMDDVTTALSLEKKASYLYEKASILAKDKRPEEAIVILREIKELDETPDAKMSLVYLLTSVGKNDEAFATLDDLIQFGRTELTKDDATRLKIQLLIKLERPDDAEMVFNEYFSEKESKVADFIILSLIHRAKKNHIKEQQVLREASSKLGNNETSQTLSYLANALYDSGDLLSAAELFKKSAMLDQNTNDTRRLIYALYDLGELGEALKICEDIVEKNGPQKSISGIQVEIYLKINDLQRAEKAIENYIKKFPEDEDMRIMRALLWVKQDRGAELDQYLDSKIDYISLGLRDVLNLGYLLTLRGFFEKAMEIMYSARKRFFDSPEIHNRYMAIFFHTDKKLGYLLNTDEVKSEFAVTTEANGIKTTYIITDLEPVSSLNEFSTLHPISKKLLGKRVGDEIKLTESKVSNETEKIIDIKHKYVYAFQDTMENFEKRFPDSSGLTKVPVRVNESEPTKKDFESFFKLVDERERFVRQIEDFYKSGQITLGVFSENIDKPLYELWNVFTAHPTMKLIAYTEAELKGPGIVLEKNTLVGDITSILALDRLELLHLVKNTFGKIGITKTVVDELKQEVVRLEGIPAEGFMTIGGANKDGKYLRQDVTAEQVKKEIENINSLLQTIGKYCETIPCTSILKLNNKKVEAFEDTIGKESLEAMMISKDNNKTLLTDDYYLRVLAKNEFGCSGASTLDVIKNLSKLGKLSDSETKKMITQLKGLNYGTFNQNSVTGKNI